MNESIPVSAAIYRRVSTDHQDGSLEVQEQRVADYCAYKRLHHTPQSTFADPDTSGSVPLLERKGGSELLRHLAVSGIKHLVVAKLDRLGRNTKDFLTTMERLKELGVTLHIVDLGGESITTQGYVGKLILTILAAVAEAELSTIRDRVQQRMDHKFQRQELTGNVPYGYDGEYTFADGHVEIRDRAIPKADLARLVTEHGACTGKRLLDHLEEQERIRFIAGLRQSGHTLEAIVRKVNDIGFPAKQGGAWQVGTVASVLQSRHTKRILNPEPEQQLQAA